ncbi:MAG: hypothetical protein Q9227_003670 [Pyrenula ochraceoflavens]
MALPARTGRQVSSFLFRHCTAAARAPLRTYGTQNIRTTRRIKLPAPIHHVPRQSRQFSISCQKLASPQEAPNAKAYLDSGVIQGARNLVDVKKVLVIGSGGLSIGQAGEFDYSGSQALKALKEENIKSILINPNIATIQTDHKLADEVYYLPVTPEYVTYVIERERPDGTSIRTLELSEDRKLFAEALKEINIPIAESIAVGTVDEALAAAETVGYPIIVRSAYALGGLGSGFANNPEELKNLSSRSLTLSPQILVEKSLKGWKEAEYEVVRDGSNNCITVCNMENFDPLGIHTGDSIVVAPSQTFSDEGSSMKSVGEVMAIGRTFEESFQKAIRQVDPKYVGLQGDKFEDLDEELQNPTDRRWLAVGQALLHENYSVEKVHQLTRIDRWFLHKIQNIVDCHHELTDIGSLFGIKYDQMLKAKKMGFSDKQIALCVNSTEHDVRARRINNFGIRPWVKKIDTLAAEFPADTNYLYTTYNASSHDVTFDDHGTIILGSGVYRIGSSVEFDWCAVNATLSLRNMGKKTVMINYNPETYSTDFDTADRLYFEELSYERVMDIYEMESASGVVVSVGGQLPQNIALRLQEEGGAKVLGTNPKDIDNAESRNTFSSILDSIGVDQPAWRELSTVSDAEAFADEVGYPVLVRPSYVLSGAAMSVIRTPDELKDKLISASAVSPDHPVVITKFMEGANEIDVDAVASGGQLLLHAVSEHVEAAGVHSGDATLVLPPVNLDPPVMARLKDIAEKVAKAWNITGPFNMQIIKADPPNTTNPEATQPELKVIECNLRASRSFPFVSKVLGTNFIDVSTKAIVDRDVPKPRDLMNEASKKPVLATKVPQFSWTRLAGADPFLGVEMSSTGEMACFGKDLIEAYWTSVQSMMNFKMPEPGQGILLGGSLQLPELPKIVEYLQPLGYKFYAASPDVKKHLEMTFKPDQGKSLSVEVIEFPKEDKRALRDVFKKYDIRGVFNIARDRGKTLLDEDYVMRRNAVDFGVPLFMEPKVVTVADVSLQTALLFAQCMHEKLPRKEGIPPEVRSWSDFTGGKMM